MYPQPAAPSPASATRIMRIATRGKGPRRNRLPSITSPNRDAPTQPLVSPRLAAGGRGSPLCIGDSVQTGLVGAAPDVENPRLVLAGGLGGVLHDGLPGLVRAGDGIDGQPLQVAFAH